MVGGNVHLAAGVVSSAKRATSSIAGTGIVRNRQKSPGTAQNARATIRFRDGLGLSALIWSFRPASTTSSESVALSKELRCRGLALIGSSCRRISELLGCATSPDSSCPGAERPCWSVPLTIREGLGEATVAPRTAL